MTLLLLLSSCVLVSWPTPDYPYYADTWYGGDTYGWDTGEPDTEDTDDPDPWEPPVACPATRPATSGTTWYVDPAAGDDVSGDGSMASPWASLQYVVDSQVACADAAGTPLHDSAPVSGGDAIVLVGAADPTADLEISGCYLDATLTIKASVQHEPVLHSVRFRGSSGWRLDGLRFENSDAGAMVRIENHELYGAASNIDLVNCAMDSGVLLTRDDFATKASTGVTLQGPDHVTVECNQLTDVAYGVQAFGENLSVLNNHIERFSRDGIATGGHHNRFEGNTVLDSVKLDDGHSDNFFHSHMGSDPDTSSDVVITGNLFANRYTDAQPADTQGPTPCLSGSEEGTRERITVANNVCRTDHGQGIAWLNTNDSVFVNNTVVGGAAFSTDLPEGLEDVPEHSGIEVEGTGNTVRNNLTSWLETPGDHNLVITPADLSRMFAAWPTDLHLREGAPAVDLGTSEGAPTTDLEGRPRDGFPDLGAYEAP